MSPPAGGEPEAVTFPAHLEQGCAKDDPQWIVLKIDGRLVQWREALKNATLTLRGASGASLEAPGADVKLEAICEKSGGSEKRHLLPFKPKIAGSNRLVSAAEVASLVRIVCAADRPTPLRHGGAAARAASTPTTATDEDEERVVKLRPAELLEGESPPVLGFWQAGPASQSADYGTLQLRCYRVPGAKGKSSCELTGKFSDAPLLRVIGRPVQRSSETANDMTWRYMVGVAKSGVGKLHLYEADLFVIDRDPACFSHISAADGGSAGDAEAAPEPELSYGDQRLKAIQSFGTATKRRLKESEKARQVQASQVENALDANTLEHMRLKADAHASTAISAKDRELGFLAEVLPAFSLEAKEPGAIYSAGLEKVATDEQLVASGSSSAADGEAAAGGIEAVFEEGAAQLKELLLKPPGELLRKKQELDAACGSPLVSAVVRARAEQGEVVKSEANVLKLMRKLAVLRCLMTLYGMRNRRGRKYRKSVLQKVMPALPLALHHTWFHSFFEAAETDADRVLCDEKILCHALIWALYLTPKYSMNLADVIGGGRDSVDLGELNRCLKTVGCTVSTEKCKTAHHIERLDAKLKAPLTLPEPQNYGGARKKQKRK